MSLTPPSVNYTYKKPIDSSLLTRRIQNRQIYSSYIIQNQALQQGCSGYNGIENGQPAAGNIVPDIAEGARFTTEEERDRILASTRCPVTSIPVSIVIVTYNSVLAFARGLFDTYGTTTTTPTNGGALTIAGLSIGNYEYTSRPSNTTISSFTDSDWFTSTEDTVSSWIIVNGNLTVNTGQTLIPTKRKLFTVVYVKGDLTVSGTISMTGRGANHSGTGTSGGYTAPVTIPLAVGTFSSVTNPEIPSAGGAGGLGRNTNGGNSGSNGSSGETGGGGGGQRFSAGTSGAGAAGTCFTGGSAGAGVLGTSSAVIAGSAEINGGRGGDANVAGNQVSGGGAGNPGGSGTGGVNGPDGLAGTGGVLIVICEGSLSGAGTIVANGVDGAGAGGQVFGGASGGGSVNIFYGSNPASAVTATANGGTGGQAGSGGNGTARKLAL